MATDPPIRPTGLLVDYGGVLTSDVFASFEAFSVAAGLPPHTVRDRFRNDPASRELLRGLETGRIAEPEFEARFAATLGLEHSDGLIDELFGGMRPDTAMLEAVRALRAAGVRTGLLSNSWGEDRYDRAALDALFDAVVISAEVGIRKPDPEIYPLAARSLGLEPSDCVFVDDLGGNLKPARALGMTTVLHVDAETTVAELERLFGLTLR